MLLGGRLCLDCEQVYHRRRMKSRLGLWFFVPFLLPWTFIVVNFTGLWHGTTLNLGGRDFTGHPFSNAVIITFFVSLLLGGLVAGLRVVLMRLRFLSEKRAPERWSW
jgi:hypothetical protein